MLSNSDPKNINESDNFFDELYGAYYIDRVMATRNVNANGQKRGKISELLIRSYSDAQDMLLESKRSNIMECNNKQKRMYKDFNEFMSQLKETNQTLDFSVTLIKLRRM